MADSFSSILYDVDGDGIAWITLNRPERMNAIGASTKPELEKALFEHAARDDAVRCIVITGAGERAFCAGADIVDRAGERPTTPELHIAQRWTHDLFRRIETFEKPTIAAINGVAVGGGLEIALCCDIRIAASHARLGLPEVKLGALPAAGGTQRLPRLIGEGRAKELLLTGDLVLADAALAMGLVNRVVERESLREQTAQLAGRIAARAPLAVRFIKQVVNNGLQVGLDAGLEYERFAAAILATTEDRHEGFLSFVEKRDPVFKGR